MAVNTLRINVKYYHSGGSTLPWHRLHGEHEDEGIVEFNDYDVDAWVVGGEDGVFAAFWSPEREGLIDYAHGDDGHWWFAGRFSPFWVPDMAKALMQAAKTPR